MGGYCKVLFKYLLYGSNLIIWAGGLIAIGLASWVLATNLTIRHYLGANLLYSAVCILLATGVVAALAAVFGCLGAVKEIKFILVVYFIILFIIFIIMFTGGIIAYVYMHTSNNSLETDMYNSMLFYGVSPEKTANWDQLQLTHRCCGVQSSKDWLKFGSVPESCRFKPVVSGVTKAKSYYETGCLEVTTAYIRHTSALVGIVAITVACLMLLGMLFSWTYYIAIHKQYSRRTATHT